MERAELARRLAARGEHPRVPAFAPGEVIDASDSAEFIARFSAAVAGNRMIFLADPKWGTREREQFSRIIPARDALGQESPTLGWLAIPTGGSSGNVKLARHDSGTLAAAVEGFRHHFGSEKINTIGLLPLHHVSGLMGWLRTVLTGGRYQTAEWSRVVAGEQPEIAGEGWYVSLVPTQLQRLLKTPAGADWLRRFRAVLLGGAAAWPELLDEAQAARIPLAPSYGSTETAAMVCALRPEEFLAGRRGSGIALPHADVRVGENGVIEVRGSSVFFGYYPAIDPTEPRVYVTADYGAWDASGSLVIRGRVDALINSGGEKIDPAEVESVLRGSGAFADVAVVGVPDAEWGHRVVACYPASQPAVELAPVEQHVARLLALYKRPKEYRAVHPWPVNAQGKINRAALLEACRG